MRPAGLRCPASRLVSSGSPLAGESEWPRPASHALAGSAGLARIAASAAPSAVVEVRHRVGAAAVAVRQTRGAGSGLALASFAVFRLPARGPACTAMLRVRGRVDALEVTFQAVARTTALARDTRFTEHTSRSTRAAIGVTGLQIDAGVGGDRSGASAVTSTLGQTSVARASVVGAGALRCLAVSVGKTLHAEAARSAVRRVAAAGGVSGAAGDAAVSGRVALLIRCAIGFREAHHAGVGGRVAVRCVATALLVRGTLHASIRGRVTGGTVCGTVHVPQTGDAGPGGAAIGRSHRAVAIALTGLGRGTRRASRSNCSARAARSNCSSSRRSASAGSGRATSCGASGVVAAASDRTGRADVASRADVGASRATVRAARARRLPRQLPLPLPASEPPPVPALDDEESELDPPQATARKAPTVRQPTTLATRLKFMISLAPIFPGLSRQGASTATRFAPAASKGQHRVTY